MAAKVAEVMTHEVVCVDVDDTLDDVRSLFSQHGFHHLMVVRGGRLVGLLSDRDLLRHVSPFVGKMSERAQDVETLSRKVHQVMRRLLVTALPEEDATAAAQLMLEKGVSCLPVVDARGTLQGVLSWRDLMRQLLAGAEQPAGSR